MKSIRITEIGTVVKLKFDQIQIVDGTNKKLNLIGPCIIISNQEIIVATISYERNS